MSRFLAGFLVLAGASVAAQGGLPAGARSTQGGGDWPLHNLDPYNSRFSPLAEINTSNAGSLVQKWQIDLPKPANVGAATPVAVNGVLYVNSGQQLFAIDGATGKTLWTSQAPGEFPGGGRGPAIGDGRVYMTGRSIIAALDAKTGKPIPSFGTGGLVHAARAALALKDPGKYPGDFDPEQIGYQMVAAPTYANGTLYVGFAVSDSLIPGGLVAAFDGATGRAKWVFRTIPQGPEDDGWEVAKDTWSAPQRYGGGIWTQPAVDSTLNMVYVNTGNPSPNYDGSSRVGANLFTNTIIGLDATTGKLKWHFQAIHHDIWDWDLMTGPTLFDVTIGSRPVKALASLAKTCYVYALDRATGAPLFPIVETPVPTKSDIPGNQPFPTQPIPYTARHVPQTPFCATYPPKVTDPTLAARIRPMFTPYSMNEFIIQSPGLMGGPNRGSSSFSPRTGLLYVTGKNDAWSAKMKVIGFSQKPSPRGPRGSIGHAEGFAEAGKTGVTPTQNIAAYDPTTGNLAWVSEFPATTNGGNLVTAGDVLFQAIGREFYSLDAKTGRTLGQVSMNIAASGTPLTYQAGGRQFVAVAQGSTIVAFGLSEPSAAGATPAQVEALLGRMLGTWKLNVAKSQYFHDTPPQESIVTYAPSKGVPYGVSYRRQRTEASGSASDQRGLDVQILDGKEHTFNAPNLAIVRRPIDDRSAEATLYVKDPSIPGGFGFYGRNKQSWSADGKTMTIATSYFTAEAKEVVIRIGVWDKIAP